ncbi:Uncharacterised protein [Mycoplasmopsis columboralis]|uniref:Uncharacterized protein n=1 Tax=Mycoplasmopsis columboralis TaxID=171282 RepID=A0A449B6K0_9BACT|nr:hypothetical protein [Mycoplasmopsis columboralis]VEU76233.1 Uncharacterised protein [Mycoplasmopsis columboralis]
MNIKVYEKFDLNQKRFFKGIYFFVWIATIFFLFSLIYFISTATYLFQQIKEDLLTKPEVLWRFFIAIFILSFCLILTFKFQRDIEYQLRNIRPLKIYKLLTKKIGFWKRLKLFVFNINETQFENLVAQNFEFKEVINSIVNES